MGRAVMTPISARKREPSLSKSEQTAMHEADKKSWFLLLIDPDLRDLQYLIRNIYSPFL
jgi:hypothetical protein